ncbi:TfoX/Sxy family protein [Pedobacter hiemivivus]|uniref:TfoX/Sxy family protein n=1 Tax=Pedobacter hiemivivus TaxID=2530454 RepID=A0A4U1G4A3_9SPHI|nr:TfoX/Sxy family protein [Pedobacter hiemivivus]TKC57679.1 TfoX/Sxy family protein [Pedobacter hiemivivus]
MAYDEHLADRVRELLFDREDVTEKEMFSGICFMVNDKMCICVSGTELLCRIGVEKVETELEKGNCRNMMNNGRIMKDYVYVEDTAFDNQKKLKYWVELCLEFNPMAKSSKKKMKN